MANKSHLNWQQPVQNFSKGNIEVHPSVLRRQLLSFRTAHLTVSEYYCFIMVYICCNSHSGLHVSCDQGKVCGEKMFLPRTHHKWAVLTAAGKTPSDWVAARRRSWRHTSPWLKLRGGRKHTRPLKKHTYILAEIGWKSNMGADPIKFI